MIDFENMIYTTVVNAINAYDDTIACGGTHTNTPPSYPFVSIEEIANNTYQSTENSCSAENHVSVTYEVDIHTKNPLKKSKAKEITKVIDKAFLEMGFARIQYLPYETENETNYELVLRYTAVISKQGIVYRR